MKEYHETNDGVLRLEIVDMEEPNNAEESYSLLKS